MKEFIEEESIIYSDCQRGYNQLKNNFKEHLTVNHAVRLISKENNCYTNAIEGNWPSLKAKIFRRFRNHKFINIYFLRFMIQRNEASKIFINLIKYLF